MSEKKNPFEIDPQVPYRDESYTRPTKLTALMGKAEEAATRSHDAETQVGAILVSNKSGAALADGCNGFVRDADDKKLPNIRPYKHFYILHAEENLIANCGRHGIKMEDCTVVCTLSPCVKCMRLLFQCGITRVIVKNKYRDFEHLKNLKDLEITETLTPEGFTELTYRIKVHE